MWISFFENTVDSDQQAWWSQLIRTVSHSACKLGVNYSNFENGYPLSNASLQFRLKFECYKPHKEICHQMKCDVINDVKLFPTVYRKIYCPNFFDINQSDLVLQKQVH